jgi:hypothetical protein
VTNDWPGLILLLAAMAAGLASLSGLDFLSVELPRTGREVRLQVAQPGCSPIRYRSASLWTWWPRHQPRGSSWCSARLLAQSVAHRGRKSELGVGFLNAYDPPPDDFPGPKHLVHRVEGLFLLV